MGILLSAFLGMLTHAALTVGYHYLFFRDTLEEGPYYYLVALTSLFGAVLGPATYMAWQHGKTRPFLASVNCLLAGLVVLGAFVGYAYLVASNPANSAGFWRVLALVSVFFLPTVVWGLLSLRWSIRLLWKSVSSD